jgi:aminoglycoside 6'-N-acetyltransferase I
VSVRQARPADVGAILELAVAFYAEDGFATPRDRLHTHLRHLVGSQAARVAVAAVDGVITGFGITTSSYGLECGLSAELEDLYVAPAARRRGLAQALIDDSARWARGIGATDLEIVIAPNGMDVAHLFTYYLARGFHDEGRRILVMPLTA